MMFVLIMGWFDQLLGLLKYFVRSRRLATDVLTSNAGG